ncbi:hypothetical protein [Dactylosporangium sp. CA-233914]|uniref:hypothetical protein n=1 Tax=Dactylosporangium sp. CA-233914 TaxID=3239934 RepID=UPI003D8BE432
MSNATTWRSGWDVDNPLGIETGAVAKDEGTWEPLAGTGLESRDLGLEANTGGGLLGRHVRSAGNGEDAATDWQFTDTDFHWFFVLEGEITIATEDDEKVTLGKWASAYHPPYWRHRVLSVSPDYQALEVIGPSAYETTVGEDAPKPERAAEFAHLKGVYTLDTEDQYARGDGPRAWSLYRDLGTRIPTDGRIHIHIIKLDEERPSPKGGTGDHTHSMAQFFYPIQGWIDISTEGQENRRYYAGDFVMLQRGTIHNAYDASPDYATIELCVPADYTTVAQ